MASVLLLAACTPETSDEPVDNENQNTTQVEDQPLKIVTTFPPLYSFAANVVGDYGDVTNLVEPGASVHTWEPTASDLRALSEADLLVMNGLELEPFIEDMIDSAQNPNLKIVTTADAVSGQIVESADMLELDHEHEEEDHEEDHEHKNEIEADHDHEDEEGHDHEEGHEDEDEHDHHGGQDPHIWLNPTLAMNQVEAIRDALVEIDPSNEVGYLTNADAYLNTLQNLDQEIKTILDALEVKPFIVFHDAYIYYFDQYSLTEMRKAAIEPFPGKEPTATYFRELVELIESENIEVVFTEPQFNPQTVQNLQEETDIKSFEIDPIGLELSSEGYENNLKALTETFAEAFE